jgi:predicted dinucleotide-binding enzyme
MAGDVIVITVPLKRITDIPVEGLAGKVVLDTNTTWLGGTALLT